MASSLAALTASHAASPLDVDVVWAPNITTITSGQPSSKDWRDQRKRILELSKSLELPEVRKIMARDHHFRAS